MKILITGKFTPFGSRPIGGLQSWIKTVYNELKRLGHDVDVKEPHELNDNNYDLGIFSNIELTRKAVKNCKLTIMVSHGIIEAEKPDNSCDRLLFVSEGVKKHWKMRGDIIRQPIDLEYWKPKNNKAETITRFSYRTGNTHCESVAYKLQKPFIHVSNKTQDQAREIIRNSALVFATGRAALESMACGVPTVIYDHREAYQAPLMGKSIRNQMENSYSGRSGFIPTKEQVLSHSQDVINAGSQREWVKKYHDVKEVVKCLF